MKFLCCLGLWALGFHGWLFAQQDNDSFAQRTLLSGEQQTVSFHLLDATLEPGEAALLSGAGASLWYQWTAPADGYFHVAATVREEQSGLGSELQRWVFKGDRWNTLEPQFSDTPFRCRQGEVFQIAVSERLEGGLALFGLVGSLTLEYIGPPTNDSMDSPLVLEGETVETAAWLFGMTPELERSGESDAYGWWKWTAPADGWLELGSTDSKAIGLFRRAAVDKVVRVTGEPGWLPPVVAGESYLIGVAGGMLKTHFSAKLVRSLRLKGLPLGTKLIPRTSFLLSLEGFVDPSSITQMVWRLNNSDFPSGSLVGFPLQDLAAGEYFLFATAEDAGRRRYALQPTWLRMAYPDEAFSSATELSGEETKFDVDTLAGGLPLGEPNPVRWWRWVAPYSGRLEFLNEALNPISAIQVMAGGRIEDLIEVAGGRVEQGKTYHFRNRSALRETLQLRLWPVLSANDPFAQAITLPPSGGTFRLDLSDLTTEPGEPSWTLNPSIPVWHSAWYAYHAVKDGVLTVPPSQSPSVLSVEVFEGDALSQLKPVAREFYQGLWRYPLREDRTYRLRVSLTDAFAYPSGVVTFGFGASPGNDDASGAVPLEGSSVHFVANSENATGDRWGLEPSVWWAWIPPESGWAVLQYPQEAPMIEPPHIQIFRGDLAVPEAELRMARQFGFFRLGYGFPVEGGVRYLFRVGRQNAAPLPMDLTLSRAHLELRVGDVWQAGETQPKTNGLGQLLWWERLPEGSREGQKVELRAAGVGPAPARRRLVAQEVSSFRSYVFQQPDPSLPMVALLTNGVNSVYAVLQTDDGQEIFTPPAQLVVKPANDDVAGAEPLRGEFVSDGYFGSASGRLLTASLEVGEPPLGFPPLTRSVWHRWVAPASGESFLMLRCHGQPRVEVFRGEFLVEVPATMRLESGEDSTIWFPALRGETYFIRSGVTAEDPRFDGNYEVSLQQQIVFWVDLPPKDAIETGRYRVEVSSALPSEEIVKCEFLVNDEVVHETTQPPWAWEWHPDRAGDLYLGARLQLRSGEIFILAPQPASIQPANLSPEMAVNVTGRDPVFSVPVSPMGYGPTNSAWFRWAAPGDGFVATTTPVRAFREMPGEPLSELPIHLAARFLPWSRFKVEAGRTYLFSVQYRGDYELEFLPPILNDDFEQATPVTGTRVELVSLPWLATGQPEEPIQAGIAGIYSQWWKWIAPADGYLSGGNVYQGERLGQLRRLSFGDDVRVTNGATYYLVTDRGSLQNVSIRPETNIVTLFPLVANDHFADRLPLAGRRVSFGAELDRATQETGEPLVEGNQTAWWSWLAPSTGPVRLRTVSAAGRVRLGAFAGETLGGLVRLGQDRKDPIVFEAQAGQTYQIVASGTGGRGTRFQGELISEATPPNDLFEQRIELPSAGGVISGWNFGARREQGEPQHGGDFGGRSVWYRWRSPSTGTARITVSGELSQPLLGAYTGDSVDRLRSVVKTGIGSSTEFTALAGTTYAIAVDGWLGTTGDFTLQVVLEPGVEIPDLQITLVNSEPTLHWVGHPELPLRLESTTDLEVWQVVKKLSPGATVQTLRVSSDETQRWFRLVVDE